MAIRYVINESINGIVSLAKARPSGIWPDEIAAVQMALQRHPKERYYRLNTRTDLIEVYEPVGSLPDEVVADLRQLGLVTHHLTDPAREELDRHMQFTPVLRFILTDAEARQFRVERMCHEGIVILTPDSSARESQSLLLAVAPSFVVHELTSIVGVDAV